MASNSLEPERHRNRRGGRRAGFAPAKHLAELLESRLLFDGTAPASPQITSSPSSASVRLGSTPPALKDSATLSGGDQETGTLTFALLSPNGSTVDTETVPVQGNGTYTTPVGYALTASGTITGTYQWQVSYSGDANNYAADDARMFVASPGQVGEYTTSGRIVNASLISGLIHGVYADPFSVSVSGSHLFVANWNNGGDHDGTISEYLTNGAVVTAPLIAGLGEPWAPAVSGSDLFIPNERTSSLGEYTTSGSVVNASLLSGLYSGGGPVGAAVSGSNLFVVNQGTPGVIGEYTTSGATINASLISGLADPVGVVVAGSNLFVANNADNGTGRATIGEYTTSGAVVNASLIKGLSYIQGLAVDGSNLFVTSEDGTIAEYTTSGATVNASLVSGLSDPGGIAIGPSPDQQVVVTPGRPTITGLPNATTVVYGATTPTVLKDTANLNGAYSPNGTIIFRLFKGATLLDTETAGVSADGSYTTPNGYTLPTGKPVTGTYQWDVSYSGDPNNFAAIRNGDRAEQVTVIAATPTVSVTDDGGTYNGEPFPVTQATVTGVAADGTLASFGDPSLSINYFENSGTSGAPAWSPLAGPPSDAGDYEVIAFYASNNSNYVSADSPAVRFTINQAPLYVTADNKQMVLGQPLPVLTASYSGFVNGDTPASLTGPVTLTTSATSSSPVGVYPIIPGGATSPNYRITFVPGQLQVIDENVEGRVWVDFNNDGKVDFGEPGIAGISITLSTAAGQVVAQAVTDSNGLYAFRHVTPGLYTIVEGSDPAGYTEGRDSLGTITDLSGTPIAGAGAGDNSTQDVFSGIPIGIDQNAIQYNFGERPAAGAPVSKGQSAGIGFWHNKNGQALILKFAAIGPWLAATLPRTFGGLSNATPLQVANLYEQQFALKDKLGAQFMATALNVYATNASLGGAYAQSYGFTVGAFGLGESTWNTGTDGAALGVADNTPLTVMQILQDADARNILASTDPVRRHLAVNLFGGINEAGGL